MITELAAPAQPAVAPTDRVDGLRQRVVALGPEVVAPAWPTGVPTLKQGGLTDDHINTVASVLGRGFAARGRFFADADCSTMRPFACRASASTSSNSASRDLRGSGHCSRGFSIRKVSLIDGASRIGFFWRIMLPLSGPGMVTVGVLAFVASWNAYLLPLLVLHDPASQTLPLGVASFSTEYAQDTAGVLAFTSLAMIPALVFFLAMEKRIVSGLQGAVKG